MLRLAAVIKQKKEEWNEISYWLYFSQRQGYYR